MGYSILKWHNILLFSFSLLCLLYGLIVTQSINTTTLYGMFISIALIVFLSIYSLMTKLKVGPFLVTLMLTSSTIKVISVLLFAYIMQSNLGIPFLSYKDDYIYDTTSSNILEAWKTRGVGFYEDIKFNTGFYSGYPNLSASAKYFFGDNYLVPRFLNVFFSTLTIPIFFLTCKHLSNNLKHVKIITIIFAFSPVFIVYSSLQLKDTVLIFFLSTLIYGAINYFKSGINFKNIVLVVISMVAIIFFRAAILLPYLVAIIIALIASKNLNKVRNKNYHNVIWIILLASGFYYGWEYLYSSGLLSLTGEEYFESRIEIRGASDSYQGSNDLSKLGLIAVFLGPIITFLSIFLPTPIYIEFSTVAIPYHYMPSIEYYSILPMAIISLIYIIKNYKVQKVGIFIISFLLLYKIGQAGSKSILDTRQSLPAIYTVYLLLPFFNLKNNSIKTLWKIYRAPIIIVMAVIVFTLSYLRLIIR